MNFSSFLRLIIVCQLFYLSNCKKKTATSEDKVAQMLRLSSQNGVVNIDSTSFKTLIKTNKKSYSVILMLTVSLPQRRCVHCKEAYEEFEIAAASWRFSEKFQPNLFFAKVDFDFDGMNVFQALQINTAPVVLFFDAAESVKHQSMFFEKYGFSADGYAKFIQKVCGIKITIARPLNYSLICTVVALSAVLLLLIYKKKITWSSLCNIPWGIIILFFILLMTSGHMWNHIRGAQFMHYREKEMVFIEPWGDGQLIIESYIVMSINLAIGVGIILLSKAPGKEFPVTKKRVIAIAGILLTTFFFYILLSVFRKKYEGYPYSFFFL